MPEAVQALGMRAEIVVDITPEERRQLETIVGNRAAEACLPRQNHFGDG